MADNGDIEPKDHKELTYEEKLSHVNEIATPIATKSIAKKIYKVVKKASHNKKNVMCGLKQLQKAIRKGEKGVAVFAGDITPIDIMCHLPAMCEDRDVPYCYVPSKYDLGAALGHGGGSGQKACVGLMVLENEEYKTLYDEVKEQIKYLPTTL